MNWKLFFLVMWTVAWGMGATAVYYAETLDVSAQLWSWAGILVIWAFVVGAVRDGW